jgi:hypothetical protein
MEKEKPDTIIGSFKFTLPVKNKSTDEKYIKKFIVQLDEEISLPHVFKYESTLEQLKNKILNICLDDKPPMSCKLLEYVLNDKTKIPEDKLDLVTDMFFMGEGGVVRPGSLYILSKVSESMEGGAKNKYHDKYLKYKSKYMKIKANK